MTTKTPKTSASKYLAKLQSVSEDLTAKYKELIAQEGVKTEDKDRYSNKTSQLDEIGSLVKALIPIAESRKKLHIIEDVLEAVFDTFEYITSRMATVIENAVIGKEITGKITGEEALLKKMVDSIKTVGTIDEKLLELVSDTRNTSLQAYAASILGEEGKASNKYPWLYYIPRPDEMSLDGGRDIESMLDEKDEGSPQTKFSHNFKVLMKQIYLITKLNIRNLNMIRMADIKTTDKTLKDYKSILEKLLFIKVDDVFVPGEYSALSSSYKEHKTQFKTLIGDDKYKRFVSHITENGKAFDSSKTVKTETLLKYLLIAVAGIDSSDVESHADFYKSVTDTINRVITANRNITQLDIIVSKKGGSFSKDRLRTDHNASNNIFTYVKVRSDEPDKLNNRYRVSVDRNQQIMYMGYEPSPESVYEAGGNFKLKDKFRRLETSTEPYPHNYLFGPFTHIFGTKSDNKEISKHDSMSPLLDKLKNGKSVCIIGYGASGSGKTTALVYAGFEKEVDKRDGILVNFCNKLGVDKTYDNIEISLVELEGNVNEKDEYLASADFKILPVPKGDENKSKYTQSDKEKSKFYTPHTFKYSESGWTYDATAKGEDPLPASTPKKMGDFIVSVMDGKRSVKATTNNPVSSRSHMIIFIRLRKSKTVKGKQDFEPNQPYLIICDFAGVENKFDCKNDQVLKAFEPFYKKFVEEQEAQFDNILKEPKPTLPRFGSEVNASYLDSLFDNYGPEGSLDVLVAIQKTVSKAPKDLSNVNVEPLRTKLSAITGIATTSVLGTVIKGIWPGYKASAITKLSNTGYTSKQSLLDVIDVMITYMDIKNQLITYDQRVGNARTGKGIAKKGALSTVCSERVKEGQFINDSLEHLRIFISYFVTKIQGKDTTVMNPKFIDACIPIQCNPNYEDCFGFSALDEETDEKESNRKSVIATQIRQKLCCDLKPSKGTCDIFNNCNSFSDMTFCIFNVINLTRKTNNPPPVPYIDITQLINEQTRLESLSRMMVEDGVKITDDRTVTLVYKPYLEALRDSPLIDPNTPEGTIKGEPRDEILRLIQLLLDQHISETPPGDPDETLADLRNLITYVNKFNSLSTVGTMEFTDMIAKFGLNRTVCNYKYDDPDLKTGSLTTGAQVADAAMTIEEYKKYINQLSKLYSVNVTSK